MSFRDSTERLRAPLTSGVASIEWPTRENLPAKLEKAKAEAVYCEGCGRKLELQVRTDYQFNKMTGAKEPCYSYHDWVCPMYYGWKPRCEWRYYDESNPHTLFVLGGVLGGPAL